MIQIDKKPLVCVVDEDPSVRRALSRVLKSAGLDGDALIDAVEWALTYPAPRALPTRSVKWQTT